MSAVGVVQAFAPRYAQARVRFLEAAATAGLPVQSHPHPLPGSEGEALALDVARDGPLDADKLLIVSSACHGVEGFCGSGAQVYALHDQEWRAAAHAQGVAVLYLHALNPYGFSYLRRVTHENVDLNRNFQDFSQPLPVNTDYAAIAHLVIPDAWPPGAANQAAVQQYLAAHGESAWQAAISRGQHTYPQGLFFGGTEPTWSHRTLSQVLRAHGGAARRIGWIDLHTGLGLGVVFHSHWYFQSPENAARLGAARRQWWRPCQALQRRRAAFSGLPSGQRPRGHLRCCSGLT